MKVTNLFPMLATNDLPGTISFYEQLGFKCRSLYPNAESACWVNLCNENCEIAFHLPSDCDEPSLTGSIYLNVENVEQLWQKLKDKVDVLQPLRDMSYGMREFVIRDCNGYVLNLGQDITR